MKERSKDGSGGDGDAAAPAEARKAAAAQDLRKWMELKPSLAAWWMLIARHRPWLGNKVTCTASSG